jgi:hypothetical protein
MNDARLCVLPVEVGADGQLNTIEIALGLDSKPREWQPEPHPGEGTLRLALEGTNGGQAENRTARFSLAPLGQPTYYLDFSIPQTTGSFLLQAVAESKSGGTTVSRKGVRVIEAAQDRFFYRRGK